jgi:hypothetical protein
MEEQGIYIMTNKTDKDCKIQDLMQKHRGMCYDLVRFHVSTGERNCLASQKRQYTLPITIEARACAL